MKETDDIIEQLEAIAPKEVCGGRRGRMNKIKFSHSYYKMPFEDWIPNTSLTARLLEVLTSERKELHRGFVEYDTAFCECISKEEQKYKGFYPLPNGRLIILLLLTINSSGSHLWTTIRRYTPAKEEYYRSLRGQTVLIEIIKEVKQNEI